MSVVRFFFGVMYCSIILMSCSTDESAVFSSLDAEDTGVTFSNRITETEKYNVLNYEYVYNGGGVGIGDFNNDGLEDIFFVGNMVSNQLYLNEGNLKFKNITTQANVGAEEQWCSSVQVVDINNDGFDDIHITAMTYEDGNLRKNIMYLNKGLGEDQVPVFENVAEQFGIADSTNNTTAAFFDYDNDGDLDLYLAVNKMLKKISPNSHRKKVQDGTSPIRDILYRNDVDASGNIKFTDVSLDAGIKYGGFALGVNVSDINNDGFKDIYVTNDYLTNDIMYINNGDGTFTDKAMEYLKHTSYSAMGNDIADLNNDGLMDIVAVDMLPEDNYRRKTMLPNNNYTSYLNNERFDYQYQFIRNTLQLNQGERTDTSGLVFSEIALMSGISSTDWSWAPMIADFDNDGDQDMIITNGFPKDVTDRDFIDYNSDKGSFVIKEDLLKLIPSVKIKNYAYRNETDGNSEIPTFSNVTTDWGITETSFSNGGAYVDLDNDGDLDYVVNNINDSASIYESHIIEPENTSANWLKIEFQGSQNNISSLGAVVEIYYSNGQYQRKENTPYRGYLSSVQSGLHFGLGSIDEIEKMVVSWHDKIQVLMDVKANQLISLKYSEGIEMIEDVEKKQPLFVEVSNDLNINYTQKESDYTDYNVQHLLMHKLSQYGPAISVSDIDGDGLDDFYIGGSHFNKGRFFIQSADGTFSEQDLLPGVEGDDKKEEELGTLFFDADNDGDQDLYLVSGGYEYKIGNKMYMDRLFINNGGKLEHEINNIPRTQTSGSCVKASDYDKDGDLDLFIGTRVKSFEYPISQSSYILENDGNGKFNDVSNKIAPGLENMGMVCDALWTDVNNDGWTDLMVVGEWMPLKIFMNDKGTFSESKSIPNSEGWWNSLVGGDFDNDGDIDYIAGNLGENTLLSASTDNPIGLYYADFDGNESLDIFPSAYFKDEKGEHKEFPYFGLGDMQKEVIKLKGQYKRHFNFAKTPMDEVLNKFEGVSFEKLQAKTLQSSYIENKGNGEFAITALPKAAQVAPIFGMKTRDINQDGNLDVLLVGNDYGSEVGQGRMDALNGLVLLGDGKGGFMPMSMQESGLVVAGDAKSVAELTDRDGNTIVLAGQNRGKIRAFKNGSQIESSQTIRVEQYDSYALITNQDGTTYRQEFYFGDSFLSQSSRVLSYSKSAKKIEIFNTAGESRIVNK